MLKRCSFVLFALATCCLAKAQMSFEEYKTQIQNDFEQYKERGRTEFMRYRDEVNRKYADFMQQAWKHRTAAPAEPVPVLPEPVDPTVFVPVDTLKDKELPFVYDKPSDQPTPQPQPLVPVEDKAPVAKPDKSFTFNFYGTRCTMPWSETLDMRLPTADEKNVAAMWRQLSDKEYIPLISRCITYKKDLNLSDWGYVRFIDVLSAELFPGRPNEANVLKMFLLNQSGYKVRMCRSGDGRLFLLLPSRNTIYNYSYINIDSEKYYIIDRKASQGGYFVFEKEFPDEKPLSLKMLSLPVLNYEPSQKRVFRSTHNPEITVEVSVNRNLIDFFNDYPLSDHPDFYVLVSLSDEVKNQLYPQFNNLIDRRSMRDAANVLLHFVQTAFKYKTDDEQFGYERPLFADETFFYPYSDCEDRAILFAVLVRDILGLDVVLTRYPEHIATAVAFEEPVIGDYFEIGGKKYTVCDPTYINADIGKTMPQYKNTCAEIISL